MPNTVRVSVGPLDHDSPRSLPLKCSCGWSTAKTVHGDSDRKFAEKWAESHLRQEHAINAPQRRKTRKTLTLTGLDEAFFKKDERRRYQELGSPGKAREYPKTLAATALWALVVVPLFLLGIEADKTPEPNRRDDVFIYLLLVVMVGGIGLIIYTGARETRGRRQRLRSEYLDSIGYHDRRPREPSYSSNDSDGPVYWATGNYDPERYYRETNGWSKEFRDYVRDSYGDLDTYNSNKPD